MPAGRNGDDTAVGDELRSDPDDQAARGLTPDEQRAERERESQQTDETKFHQALEDEHVEREELIHRVGEPLEPSDE